MDKDSRSHIELDYIEIRENLTLTGNLKSIMDINYLPCRYTVHKMHIRSRPKLRRNVSVSNGVAK
jgi:hypothetical protein